MALKALLTVDFHNEITPEQRKKLNERLNMAKWMNVSGLTTTWTASFEPIASKNSALVITQTDLNRAVKAAGITGYKAAVQFGEIEPDVF